MTSKKKKQLPQKTTQSLEDIGKFCLLGASFGSGFIVLYVINATSLQKGLSTLGIIGAVSGASFVLGFVIGFLFGVPRTIESNNSVSSVNSQTRVQANTNLEQISDWLTKILVGVGLTQITPILSFVKTKVIDNLAFGFDLFNNQNIANYRPSSLSISITIGITSYFLLSGFMIGYFYTVLVFSQSLKENYEQKLEEKIDNSSRANNRIQLVRQIIDLVSPLTTEGNFLDDMYMSGRKKDSSDILSKIAENVNKSLDYLREDNDTIPEDFDDFVAGLIKNIDSDDYVLFRSTDYVNLAVLLALKGDQKNANKFLDKAISTNQYSYDAYNLKGLIDNKLKNYDLAIESFNRAIEIDRKNVKAWENKGGVLVNKIENSGANASEQTISELVNELLECSERAIILNPNSTYAYVNKGFALSYLNRKEEQLEAYEQAIKVDPKYPIAFYKLACVYSQMYLGTQTKYLGLIKPRNQISGIARFAGDSAYLVFIFNYAYLLTEQAQQYAKKAIENLRRAIKLNPDAKIWAQKETDFAAIRLKKEFAELVK